jgi:hypothetical protein
VGSARGRHDIAVNSGDTYARTACMSVSRVTRKQLEGGDSMGDEVLQVVVDDYKFNSRGIIIFVS